MPVSETPLEEFLAIVRRDLGAEEARLLEAGESLPPNDPHLRCEIPGGRSVVARFAADDGQPRRAAMQAGVRALQRLKIGMPALGEDGVGRATLHHPAAIEHDEIVSQRGDEAEISDRIMENMSVISESASRVANLLKSVCILIFAMIYLTRTSLPAFLMIAMILGVGFSIYVSKQRQIKQYLLRAAQERLTFFDILMDLLRGFKEVKFSRRRGREARWAAVITSASRVRRCIGPLRTSRFTSGR